MPFIAVGRGIGRCHEPAPAVTEAALSHQQSAMAVVAVVVVAVVAASSLLGLRVRGLTHGVWRVALASVDSVH